VHARRPEAVAPDPGEGARSRPRRVTPIGAYGERPPGPFGGLPVSELAIFAGAVALIVGAIRHGGPALIGGVVLCLLGVTEVTAREHFSGYRSHTTLLAAIPAVALAIGVLSLVGVDKRNRAPFMLAIAVPVYAFLFWQLRRRFMVARQARVARPPAP
jgi:hypothetical protein